MKIEAGTAESLGLIVRAVISVDVCQDVPDLVLIGPHASSGAERPGSAAVPIHHGVDQAPASSAAGCMR